MREFEFLEHTADLKFRAYGETLEECFANAARAVFSAIINIDKIDVLEEREIILEGTDIETLLHDWLSELIFLFSTENVLFKDFSVSISGNKLSGIARGEKFDTKKHTIETEVKAVTYHAMKIKEESGQWTAEVVCDT